MADQIKKSLAKRIVKTVLITLLSLILLLLIGIGFVINFVFTPSKLTPIVENAAKEFLNADVSFEEIELTFFSTFPDFGLKITDGTVISGALRDSAVRPESRDSLMHMKTCLVTVNPVSYLVKNRIEVKEFLIEQPEIYAYVDTTGRVNWDLVRAADSVVSDTAVVDTTSFNSRISIKNVRIRDGKVVFEIGRAHV